MTSLPNFIGRLRSLYALYAVLVAVHVAGRQMLQKNLQEELAVGGRVLDQLLASRGRQLSDTVRVLAADFAVAKLLYKTISYAMHVSPRRH